MPRYSQNNNVATGKVPGMLMGVEDITEPLEEDRMQQMEVDKLLFKSEVIDSRSSTSTDRPASANQARLNKDEIDAHKNRTDNPHVVTKEQVDLGNADNTSDANKPVSTAQQEALNAKESITNVNALKGVDWTDETVKGNADDIATLNDDVTTEGSVAKSIKDNAEDATFTPTVPSGIASETIEEAINELGVEVVDHEDRIDTLESDLGDIEIDVADMQGTGWTDETIKDNADAIALKADQTALETVKVKTSENDLAIADIRRDQTLANQSEAKISVSDYGIVALPKNATGNLKMKREGITATNIVNGADIADAGTVTFASVLNDIYYDVLNKVQITGTGSDIVVTNDSGVIANMAIINLTQTFASVPDLATSKKIFPTYFADTKNVPMTGRYRGRGKNLFDKSKVNLINTSNLRGVDGNIEGTGYAGASIRNHPFLSYFLGLFKKGKTYTFSSSYPLTIDSEGQIVLTAIGTRPSFTLRNAGGGRKSSTFTIPEYWDEYLNSTLIFYSRNWAAFSDIQIEEGIVATPYAPYEAHDLYLTAPEGRSVPSAKDSVEVQDGKLVYVKRVSTPVAVSSGVAVNVTNYPLAKTGGNFRVELTAGGVQIGVIGTDSTSGAGTLTYELATPITTPIDSDGSLPAGSSVYFEPVIPDVGIYTTKFDILDTDHPIASIDKLYKVDFATGVQTLLTDAVVAGDGLSFTSASLTDGDLVNVIYYYSVANPEGLTTAEYLNSNVVVADSANGKYYKYKPVVTNGAIASWTLTEVV